MYGFEASNEIAKIHGMCYEFVSKYQMRYKLRQESSSYATSLSTPLLELTYDEPYFFSKFDLYVYSTIEENHTKSELDYYLEEFVFPKTSAVDVLSWSKTNGIKYISDFAEDF